MKNSKPLNNVPFFLENDNENCLFKSKAPEVAIQFHATILKHDGFKKGLETIGFAHKMSGLEGAGMTITGVPGVGKSTLLNSYVKHVYKGTSATPTDELTPLPVLKILVPGKPSIPRVIESLLASSKHIKSMSKSSDSASSKLDALIINQRVEMIIIDEFQHLMPKNTSRPNSNSTIQFLKVLADKHKLSLVLAGLPEMLDVLSNFEELDQRMNFGHVKLCPFNINSTEEAKDFVHYIVGLEDRLNDLNVDCCGLADDNMLQRLLLATQGRARLINRLLMRLLMEQDTPKPIQLTDFSRIYSELRLNKSLGAFNPFDSSLSAVQSQQKAYYQSLINGNTPSKGRKNK